MKSYIKSYWELFTVSQDYNWEVPDFVYTNWSDVSVEYLREVFNQAEKFLKELTKAGEDITTKAFKILSINIGILTISAGYLLTTEHNGYIQDLEWISTVALIFSFISTIGLIKPIWSYQTFVIGSEPSKLMAVKEAIANFKKPEKQVKNLIFSECKQYQARINAVIVTNSKRLFFVNLSMIILLLIPTTFIIIWLWRTISTQWSCI